MQRISGLCLSKVNFIAPWVTFLVCRNKGFCLTKCRTSQRKIYLVMEDTPKQKHSQLPKYKMTLALTIAGILKILGLSPEEEDSELVQIIKKGELELLKQEYTTSESLFHIALRLAQQLQNEQGITYIYDRLANVAFEGGYYEKARKLFVNVMQRLIDDGMDTEDLAIIHISFKLAKCFEHLKDYQNAEIGYNFCIQGLIHKLKEENPEYKEAQELWMLVCTGYAYFHYNLGRWEAAQEFFQKAYETSVMLFGEDHEKTLFLLNNLGSTSRQKGDLDAALTYLHRAEKIGNQIPDLENFSFILLNIGYSYLETKMMDQAELYCRKALINSSRLSNEETKKHSEECLSKVKEALK